MGWSISDLGIAAVTVLGVVPSLLIAGLVFLMGFATLVLLGLVSAVLYAVIAVGFLWLLSLFGVFNASNISNHPKTLLLLLIVP